MMETRADGLAKASARFLQRNAALLLLALALAGVAYLYLAVPRDGQRSITDAMRPWIGDSSGGLYLGYAGTLLIVAAQVYTAVKRSGSPTVARKLGGIAVWLDLHIALSLIGFVAVAVHAGFPFRFHADRLAQNGFAGPATWLLLITTVSGIFGRYLYRRIHLFKRAFRFWKETHLVVTFLFFLFTLIHIVEA